MIGLRNTVLSVFVIGACLSVTHGQTRAEAPTAVQKLDYLSQGESNVQTARFNFVEYLTSTENIAIKEIQWEVAGVSPKPSSCQ